MYIHIYIYVRIHVYIKRETEKKREIERERHTHIPTYTHTYANNPVSLLHWTPNCSKCLTVPHSQSHPPPSAQKRGR